jgi:thioredoxin reductase
MLTTEVENYPGFEHGIMGPEMMASSKQAERFGTKVFGTMSSAATSQSVPSNSTHNPAAIVRAHAVIIATGATANWLGLPNEMRLATTGGGVSACAVCDGALPAFRNQPLAVVGGGDTAMEEATYLTKFASEVYIIHRRDSFRASKIMQERFLSRPNAKVLWNKVVVDVLGADKITGVHLKDTVTGEALDARREGALRRDRTHPRDKVPEGTPGLSSTMPGTSRCEPVPARPTSRASSPRAMSRTASIARQSRPPAWAARPRSTPSAGSPRPACTELSADR